MAQHVEDVGFVVPLPGARRGLVRGGTEQRRGQKTWLSATAPLVEKVEEQRRTLGQGGALPRCEPQLRVGLDVVDGFQVQVRRGADDVPQMGRVGAPQVRRGARIQGPADGLAHAQRRFALERRFVRAVQDAEGRSAVEPRQIRRVVVDTSSTGPSAPQVQVERVATSTPPIRQRFGQAEHVDQPSIGQSHGLESPVRRRIGDPGRRVHTDLAVEAASGVGLRSRQSLRAAGRRSAARGRSRPGPWALPAPRQSGVHGPARAALGPVAESRGRGPARRGREEPEI